MGCGCNKSVRSLGRSKMTVSRSANRVISKVSKSVRASRLIPRTVLNQQAAQQAELEQGTSAMEKQRRLRDIRRKIIAQKLGHH